MYVARAAETGKVVRYAVGQELTRTHRLREYDLESHSKKRNNVAVEKCHEKLLKTKGGQEKGFFGDVLT